MHNIEQEVLKCEQCESSYLTQSGLRKHMKTNHEQPPINSPNVEPFVKRITRVTGKQVLAHKAIELIESEEEEIFKCGHCKSTFSTKANLTRHMKVLHENLEPRVTRNKRKIEVEEPTALLLDALL